MGVMGSLVRGRLGMPTLALRFLRLRGGLLWVGPARVSACPLGLRSHCSQLGSDRDGDPTGI